VAAVRAFLFTSKQRSLGEGFNLVGDSALFQRFVGGEAVLYDQG
jgi:hypothetical protein